VTSQTAHTKYKWPPMTLNQNLYQDRINGKVETTVFVS